MSNQETYAENRLKFTNQLIHRFRNSEINVFIIVEYLGPNSEPIINFIHRLRFGPDILPIPAWLSQEKAEQFIQRLSGKDDGFEKNKVIEISHAKLQAMIDKQQYASDYPPVSTYHLDLQVNQQEVESFLDQFNDK